MATSRKDVELVIRAKDETSKAANAVVAALDAITGGIEDATKGAKSADSVLGGLGKAFDTLASKLKGLDVSANLAQQFDAAAQAADRLESGLADTAKEVDRLGKESKEAAAEVDRLAEAQRKAAGEVDRQAAALKKQKATHAELNAELRKASADREKHVRAEQRLSAALDQQGERVEKAKTRYSDLSGQLQRMANPTETFKNRVDAASTALEKQTTKYDKLKSDLATSRTQIEQTGTAVDRLAARLTQSNTAVERQGSALQQARSGYEAVRVAARAAGDNQQRLASETSKATDRLERQNGALTRTKTEMGQLRAASNQATAGMQQLSSAAGGQLQQVLDQQRRSVVEAGRAWKELVADSKALRASMVEIGPPTRHQAQELNYIAVSARAARTEYQAQRAALQQMSTAYRQTGGSVDGLRAAQQRFVEVQAQTGGQIARVRQEAQQQIASYNRLAQAANQAATATRSVGAAGSAPPVGPVNALADAYRRLYGESRQAMSWTQRLRGEVLSLVSAYAGIYGVIGMVRETVNAFMALEAVQNRLNVVFNNDYQKAGVEIDFLRRNSDRLGISLAVLGQEYSKFAVATNVAGFELDATRKIFLSVAEAGRVNKLSMEQMSGIFLALEQMISKGKVTSEELRRQLGDRLPGAFSIMASALDMTTAELDNAMKAGEVFSNQDTMLKFADELAKRFGVALPDALKSTTTELGRFQNEVFKAFLQIGEAGFIDSFTELLRTLNAELASPAGIAGLQKIGQTLAFLIDIVQVAVDNWNVLVMALSVIVGIKATPLIILLGGAIWKLIGHFRAGVGAATTFSAAVVATGTAAGGARSAITLLTAAVRGLMSATGVGVVVTGLSLAFSYWITSATDATEALAGFREAVDQARNSFDAAGRDVEKFAEGLEKINVAQANSNLQKLKEQAETAREAIGDVLIGSPTAATNPVFVQTQKLIDAFRSGELSAEKFRKGIDEIAKANPEFSKNLLAPLATAADSIAETEQQIAELAATLALIEDPANEAALAVLGLETESQRAWRESTKRAEEFAEAMRSLKGVIDEASNSADRFEIQQELADAYEEAKRLARGIDDIIAATERYNRERARLDEVLPNYEANYTALRNTPAGSAMEELVRAATVVADKIGISAKDLIAVMSFETKGTFDPWIKGPTTQHGVHRGLIQWGEPQRAKYGITQDTSITDQVIAAGKYLEDAGVKAGDGLMQVYAAVLTGSAKHVNRGDTHNGGVVSSVIEAVQGPQFAGHIKRAEGLVAAYAGIAQEAKDQVKTEERLADEAEKKLQTAREFHEQQQASLENQRFELENNRQALIEREVAKALRDAELAAQKAGTELSQEERDAIVEVTTAKYAEAAADEILKKQKEELAELQERVNNLLAQQGELQKQLALHQEAGDQEKVAETKTELERINAELEVAIANALAFNEALGGAGADATIAKLQTQQLELQKVSQQGKTAFLDWKRVGDLFASGLTNAFDKFAQAVANGEDVGKAAREAFLQFAADYLRQIAQMIIQRAILNALEGFFPGMGFGGASVRHSGGYASAGGTRRMVNPAIFNNATRYHTGGIAGLKPGEVPTILKVGEEVLTQSDPRHAMNGGRSGGGGGSKTKIVNAIDSPSFLAAALESEVGEQVFMNYIRANAAAVKSALG